MIHVVWLKKWPTLCTPSPKKSCWRSHSETLRFSHIVRVVSGWLHVYRAPESPEINHALKLKGKNQTSNLHVHTQLKIHIPNHLRNTCICENKSQKHVTTPLRNRKFTHRMLMLRKFFMLLSWKRDNEDPFVLAPPPGDHGRI